MVDITVVRRILNSLNESLEHLRSKQAISFNEYKKDMDILIDKVYEILQNSLSDFYSFAQTILDYLNKYENAH